MSGSVAWIRWAPSPVSTIAGVLVIAGLLLTALPGDRSFWFLALTAVGAFGPGILRESGWLKDQDEFKRRAAHRAGYHAFIVTGLAAFLLYAYTRSGGTFKAATELSLVYIALLWFTWMFSSLFSYWGPHRTAFRILIIFGCVWGVFIIGSHITEPSSMVMELLILAVPFFFLAFLSRRWPRVAGVLLIAVSLFLLGYYFYPGHFGWVDVLTKMSTAILFAGPLVASGVALLRLREGRPVAESDRRESAESVGAH
jgi:hypothetical protein